MIARIAAAAWMAAALNLLATARAAGTAPAPWPTCAPHERGLDAAKLDQFAARVGGSGCIVKDGFLVATWGDPAAKRDWASAAKPVLSTLLLFALHEGRIPSVDAPIADLGWPLAPKDRPMTFRHLANMVSGYGRGEPPGAAWAYNDYAINLYAASLEKVLGEDLDHALRSRMANLGFEDGSIFSSRNGRGVVTTPRDFARIGWFWLQRGRWNGVELLPRALFEEHARPGVPPDLPRTERDGTDDLAIGSYGGSTDQTRFGPGIYGLNWWFNEPVPGRGRRAWPALPADAFQANGMWNRDVVLVLPSMNIVVAFCGGRLGKFDPGQAEGDAHENLALLMEAARFLPRIPKWQPHDLPFEVAAPPAAPFDVEFSATLHGPEGASFTLPGFHDGNGTWTIRLAPTAEGPWSVETRSSLPELDGRRAAAIALPNDNPRIHGALRVDPEHPRHFRYEDGSRPFLMAYECDWLWALDMNDPALPRLSPFLDTLAEHGFNHVLLNAFAHDTGWRRGRTGDDDFGPPPDYPWAGSNDAPDQARFNLAYWQHYDRVIDAMHRRGIGAHIMIKVYNKQVKWPECGGPDDDRYFRWLVARYAAYPNVVWDFSKEAHNEKSLDYKLGRFRLLRALDGYRRLVTNHDDDAAYDAGAYNALLDFRTDQQHSMWYETIVAQHRLREWPVINAEFGYEHGPQGMDDKTYGVVQPPEEVCRRAWHVCLAGGYPAYYYTHTAWDVVRPEDRPTGYRYFRNLRDFFVTTGYWRMRPAPELASAGRCLAEPGREYIVLLDPPQPVTLELGARSAAFEALWYQPFTGQRIPASPAAGAGTEWEPSADWDRGAPAVLHLRRPAEDGQSRASVSD